MPSAAGFKEFFDGRMTVSGQKQVEYGWPPSYIWERGKQQGHRKGRALIRVGNIAMTVKLSGALARGGLCKMQLTALVWRPLLSACHGGHAFDCIWS
jgi:hypothetical protein